MKQRKGSIQDVGFLIIMLFFIGVVCFIGYFTFNEVSDRMISSPAINETTQAVDSLNAMKSNSRLFDYFGLAVFLGMSLAIIITSWFIGGHPLFIAVFFLVMVGLVVGAMVLSNVWETLTQTATFGYLSSPLPITNHLITYLPIYMVVVGFLGMIAMFGKPYLAGAEY